MALLLSPEQELIKQVVREFADKELGPQATAIDRESRFPKDHYGRMAPLGLLGMMVAPDAGGSGMDTLSFVVAMEEVARASGTDAAMLILQNAVVAPLLQDAGANVDAWLKPSLAGQKILAAALVEEAGGAAIKDLLTMATRVGDGYRLNGSKAFVGLAGTADAYIVLAKTEKEGPSLFLVDGKLSGLHFSASESKLGLRGLPLADMYINRVELGPDALVGTAGQALPMLAEPMRLARLGVAAALVGLTQAALEMSLSFARQRVQFGQPIVKYGAIRGFLADLQADLDAARATVYGAAALRDSRKDHDKEVFEARLLAHRIAVRGTRTAQKIHGGAGFMRDLPLERVSRDVRTLMHMWDAHDITRARLADLFVD